MSTQRTVAWSKPSLKTDHIAAFWRQKNFGANIPQLILPIPSRSRQNIVVNRV